MIPFFLSLPIGMAVAWIGFLAIKNIEQRALRAKWMTPQNQNLAFIWNRSLISLTLPFFKNQGVKDPELWSWGLWLGLEFSILTPLVLGWDSAVIFCGGLTGALYPFFWRQMEKRKKTARMKRDLPFFIDLLSIAVQAGMDLLQAVEKIVQTLPPSPLLGEFAKMLEDLKLGRTRKEALQFFKARVPLPEIRVLVSLLLQAIQFGTPLSSVLLATARQMRERRFSRAERLGSQSAVKILFPLVFCLMPSLFLLVFAPLVLNFSRGGLW